MLPSAVSSGEVLSVAERVIIAPVSGRFRPVPKTTSEPVRHTTSEPVLEEQVIGFIDGSGHSTPVLSAFTGSLIGMLAHAGERVREGQPVAWLRMA